MRLIALLLASATLSACQQSNTASNDQNTSAPAAENSSLVENAATTAANCVAGMKSEIDKASFDGMAGVPSAEKLEALRAKADPLFREVANRMCAANEIKPEEIGVFKRLLIQNGGGADSTAIYGDSEIHGRDTLVFQYVFEGRALGVPDAQDVREGLLCHFGDDEKYREMCESRLP